MLVGWRASDLVSVHPDSIQVETTRVEKLTFNYINPLRVAE